MQNLLATNKGVDFLNKTLSIGDPTSDFSFFVYAPNGRELRRRAARQAKKNAKKGIPTTPSGFIETLELL